MTGKEKGVDYRRLLVLGLALALTFNLIPVPVAIVLVSLVLLILLSRIGWPAVMTSLALFGMILYSLFNRYLGIGLTAYHILTTGIIVLMMIIDSPKNYPGVAARRWDAYLVWLGLVWILLLIGYLTGPRSEYSSYFIVYFLVYGTSFVLAGILAALYSVTVEKITLPSLLVFSCIFPLLRMTPFQMPTALDPHWGLRGVEEFSILYHERLAGLLFVILLIRFITAVRKIRELPIFVLGGLISLPIIWFSYTRQAIAAVLIVAVAAVTRTLFSDDFLRSGRRKALVLLLATVLAGGVMYWFLTAAPLAEGTRMGAGGALIIDPHQVRVRMWRDSLRYIEANPIIGYGLGWFAGEWGRLEFDWPHNWFIEAWLEHGLPGLILFLIGTGFIIYPILRPCDRFTVFWALAGLYWLIVIQLSGDIARNSMIFFFITLVFLRLPSALIAGGENWGR